MTEEPTLHLPVSTLRHALEQACANPMQEYRDPAHFADQSQARKWHAAADRARRNTPTAPTAADLQQPEPDADVCQPQLTPLPRGAAQLAGICVAAGTEYPDLEESCSARDRPRHRGARPDPRGFMADYPPASTHSTRNGRLQPRPRSPPAARFLFPKWEPLRTLYANACR